MPPAARQVRDVALLFPDEPLYCPRGHIVPKRFWSVGGAGAVGYECTFRSPPGDQSCSAVVFLLPIGSGARLVIEVTKAELHAMEQRNMGLRQIRDLLNFHWRAD